ncbi:MAG TPA: hypothetical protein VFC46_04280, partial [Humisphaera sp.]|nr:hypothetical protein [Humisphaera sp.]
MNGQWICKIASALLSRADSKTCTWRMLALTSLTAMIGVTLALCQSGCSVAAGPGAYASSHMIQQSSPSAVFDAPESLTPPTGYPKQPLGATVHHPAGADLVAPQSLPSRDEELWVIEKNSGTAVAATDSQLPGSGALMAKLSEKPQDLVAVPLKHTDVKASIAGYIA